MAIGTYRQWRYIYLRKSNLIKVRICGTSTEIHCLTWSSILSKITVVLQMNATRNTGLPLPLAPGQRDIIFPGG